MTCYNSFENGIQKVMDDWLKGGLLIQARTGVLVFGQDALSQLPLFTQGLNGYRRHNFSCEHSMKLQPPERGISLEQMIIGHAKVYPNALLDMLLVYSSL